jgi:hypothetical protein
MERRLLTVAAPCDMQLRSPNRRFDPSMHRTILIERMHRLGQFSALGNLPGRSLKQLAGAQGFKIVCHDPPNRPAAGEFQEFRVQPPNSVLWKISNRALFPQLRLHRM